MEGKTCVEKAAHSKRQCARRHTNLDFNDAKHLCASYRIGAQSELQSSLGGEECSQRRQEVSSVFDQLFFQVVSVLESGTREIEQRVAALNTFYQTDFNISRQLQRIKDSVVYFFDCAAERKPTLQQLRMQQFEQHYGKQNVHFDQEIASQQFENLYKSQVELSKQQEAVFQQQITALKQENSILSTKLAEKSENRCNMQIETLELQRSRLEELSKSEAQTRHENDELRRRMQQVLSTKQLAEKQVNDLKKELQDKREELMKCQGEVDDLIKELRLLE